jgi:hypothetical protein
MLFCLSDQKIENPTEASTVFPAQKPTLDGTAKGNPIPQTIWTTSTTHHQTTQLSNFLREPSHLTLQPKLLKLRDLDKMSSLKQLYSSKP